MGWKKKEKPLSAEEAVAFAKKELAPFWFGCEPMIAGIKTPSGAIAYPVGPTFNSQVWLIVFFDPTEFIGESVLEYVRGWHRRYADHDVHVLGVLRLGYRNFRSAVLMDAFLKRLQIHFPVVIDADGLLAGAFGVTGAPKVAFFDKGKLRFQTDGEAWLEDTESKIQNFLRESDPGLPLEPPIPAAEFRARDVLKIDFGRVRGVEFPDPGFKLMDSGFGVAAFQGEKQRSISPGAFSIGGSWMQDDDRIATSDPTAWILFHCPASRFSLVAQAISKITESARVVVEVNGIPAYDTFAGINLQNDDEGASVVKVESPDLYHVLVKLTSDSSEIMLKFPAADRVPIAIYGLRAGA